MPRMRILSASEQEVFDKPPLFDYRERKKFFSLPKGLLNTAKSMRRAEHQIQFLVSCGYFRATRRFFASTDFEPRDFAYVASQLGYNNISPSVYPDRTRQRHQQLILDFYGFSPFDKKAKKVLLPEINTMARMHLKPRLIFDRSIDFLIQRRIQVPTVRSLTDMIRLSLHERKMELVELMEAHLTDDARNLMDELFTTSDDNSRYRLTLLKKLSQSTKPRRIKECIVDFETLETLYNQLEATLSLLNLGVAGIRYHAGSVMKSEIFQMQRRNANDRYIHAAAFIAHQFFRMQDNMVDLWLSVMASFQTTVSRKHKEILLESRKAQQQKFQTLAKELDASVSGLVQGIRRLTNDKSLTDRQKVIAIRETIDQRGNHTLSLLKADLESSGKDRSWHDLLEEHSIRLQNRLSPILRVIKFQPNNRTSELIEAIDYFKICNGAVNERAPMGFLDADEQSMLTREEGGFRPSLYKVLLFQHITVAIKSGDLNLAKSYKYRPMDAYLINSKRWAQEKSSLLERAGLTEFIDPEPVLAKLDKVLNEQYKKTNAHISTNPYLKFRSDGVFQISTPALESDESDVLESLFPERHHVPLAQVLETINNHCNMLSAFEHWQQTHTKQETSRPVLLAGIIGLGCGIGVRKMARISSCITESELENAVNWRFSLDNIRAANDAVLKAMDQMELPNLYRQEEGMLHTASDGQKYGVTGESLHASRSFKYFGQGQGISAYGFVDERGLLWYSLIISPADRESTYVIDGIMHNDVVKSDIHSTDTHGYTEVVFGLTHLLGLSFAPRIKGIGKQKLYLFRGHDRNIREEWKISPDNYINDVLIRENWDELLRLVATIKLKENTASDIFRRLNSYSRQHALYQTIKAFGQIIKSDFILRYVDNLDLRQAIEKQLNKIELANKFSRAVAVGSPREFLQTEKDEQEIAESCNRLIKNSIICWNYLYLNRKLEKAPDSKTADKIRRTIEKHSPMSWAHINMLGEYDFSEEKLKDSIGILPLKSNT